MRHVLTRLALLSVVLVAGCSKEADSDSSASQKVVIWWAEWAPATGLAELAKEFTAETGIAVEVKQIPWPSYQDQVFLNFTNKTTDFDIVVGDSQWIGRGATNGLYVDLTDWLPTVVDLKTINPQALRYLCEYPSGSGRFFAAPAETDAIGFAYRKDWFEDPTEQQAFRAKFGRELAPPKTWDEFRDLAEFFTRSEQNRYGCALLTGRDYDSLTMGFQQVMWAFGGSWGDPETKQVSGQLNGPATVQAIEFYRELVTRFSPPGGTNFSYDKCLESLKNGSVAMSMNYFAFSPEIVRSLGNKVGFFPVPGHEGRRFISLGGQGMSISAKTNAARQENARKFIAWFLQDAVQRKWVQKEAGFTASQPILDSAAFRDAQPYNAAFAESLNHVRDFWNVPQYNELLSAAQQAIAECLDGKPIQPTLDALAKKHEAILKR
jgi:multiple sugar transport system substrate-binding protein